MIGISSKPLIKEALQNMNLLKKFSLFTIVAIAAYFCSSYFATLFFPKPSPEPVTQAEIIDSEPEATAHIQKTDKNTKVTIKTSYNGCGHSETRTDPVPSPLSGKPVDTVAASYTGCIFDRFENDTIFLVCISQNKCDHHYILKAENNTLQVVYQNDPSRIRDEYEFSPSHLPKEELQKLNDGIKADSDAQLSRLIEDYTS